MASDPAAARTLARAARQRADAATEGPWNIDPFMEHDPDRWIMNDAEDVIGGVSYLGHHDGEFVIHAREDVPALCDAVEALAADVERLRAHIREKIAVYDQMVRDVRLRPSPWTVEQAAQHERWSLARDSLSELIEEP